GAGTILTDANFTSSSLHCTNFSWTDVTQSVIAPAGKKANIVTNFSCRTNLSNATLNVDTFPLTQWRYLNLNGTTINDVAGATLSTTTSPLNLSGAILSNMDLSEVILDGADFGCAVVLPYLYCTDLSNTKLTSASLKQAAFDLATLQGANLDFAHLESTDL